jgi:hypothetical protein
MEDEDDQLRLFKIYGGGNYAWESGLIQYGRCILPLKSAIFRLQQPNE